VDERTRLAMFKLRQTWPQYFSGGTLHNLDTRTHYIDPAWPITARVPDPSPSTPTIHINPDFIQRNKPTAALPAHQPKSQLKQEDNDRTVKNSDTSSRDDAYHMIPIDRKEQNRQEIEQIIIKDNDDEQQQQQSKRKKENEGKFTANNNNHEASSEDVSNNKLSVKKTASVMNHIAQNDDDVLFGGADIDYRDTDVTTQPKVTTTSTTSLDT
ncbi:unnamed protein product, partial [Rotaria magnacalcarata]